MINKNIFTEFNRTRTFQSFTLKMITDIHGAEHDKRQRRKFVMTHPCFLRNVVAGKLKKTVIENPQFELQLMKLLNRGANFWMTNVNKKLIESENTITLLSAYLRNTIVSTAISSLDDNEIMFSIVTQLSDKTTEKFSKLQSPRHILAMSHMLSLFIS